MPDLRLNHRTLPNNIVMIEAEGFLDAYTCDSLNKLIQSLFDRHCYRLIVRLDKLEYIASAGAGVFIWATQQIDDNQGGLVFLNPSATVREIFDLLGLAQIFKFAETPEQAAACLSE